jgi:ABC-type multidrug transport system permease subunit
MAGGLTALIFILERQEGMLERQWVSGINNKQTLIAYAIIRISTMVLQAIIVISIIVIWLDLPTRGPIIWIFLLLLLQNCAGMTFGLVVSALFTQENTAALTISATVMTNIALCGMIWPIEAIPYYLRWFSYIQPSTLPTEALRSLLNRGWSIYHKNVWLGFVSTILWLCLFSIMAAKFLKLK